MADKNEIESLVYLLEDPDPFIQDSVRNRLFELGERAVPLLDQHKSHSTDHDERKRIDDIIHSITIDTLEEDFIDLLDRGLNSYKDLEDAIILLARFNNPTLRSSDIRQTLDHFAAQIEDDIKYAVNDGEKMRKVLKLVFNDLGFQGNAENFHDPNNSFIDQVIKNRKGLPITLALIVIFIGRRVDLPFHGVNMPIHFMLKYESDQQKVLLDPFDQGNTISYDQCYHFLKKNGIKPRAEHFENAKTYEILLRCIRNLINSYERLGEEKRVKYLKRLLDTLEMFFQV